MQRKQQKYRDENRRFRRVLPVYILILFWGVSQAGCSSGREEPALAEVQMEEERPEGEDTKDAEEGGEAKEQEEPGESVVIVHVCGQVASPGVYELPAGSRIYEAVEAAGGLGPQAAAEGLNQAAEAEDGQQIYVPSAEEMEEGTVSLESAGPAETGQTKVNINTAGAEELMTLNGIGEAKASAIIRYREENGKFGSIEELMEISGIKEGVFEKIKDQIKV